MTSLCFDTTRGRFVTSSRTGLTRFGKELPNLPETLQCEKFPVLVAAVDYSYDVESA